MTYYAVNSTDSANNTGWVFTTPSNYFAFNSLDLGNNTGWIFEQSPITTAENAVRDFDRTPVLLATENTPSVIATVVFANAGNNGLSIEDSNSGQDFGPANAPRDANRVASLLGTSSSDGVTPVVIYLDATNHALLVKST